jgi:hypothetical protein
MRAAWAALLVVVGLASTGACKGVFGGGDLPPPPASVRVLDDTAIIKQGAIGVQDRQDATYVLVEAENGSPEPRLVSLEGDLLDASGKLLSHLYVEELRVPAKDRRVYALVAAGTFPQAASAKLRVRAAPVAKDEPIATVSELTTQRQATGLVASATIENKLPKVAIATILVAFYDANGKIVARPFAPVQLNPRSTRTFTFTGPQSASRAVAFIGDSAF